jgi:hypothetical protein
VWRESWLKYVERRRRALANASATVAADMDAPMYPWPQRAIRSKAGLEKPPKRGGTSRVAAGTAGSVPPTGSPLRMAR